MSYFTLICILTTLAVRRTLAGCCNSGFWCDGDPYFIETPDVVQERNAPFIIVSWNEGYLQQPKCVDFFYVEYKKAPENTTTENDSNMVKSPVFFEEKKPNLDEPEKPSQNKYWANISIDFDTSYLVRAVAVDKGGGWGDVEGQVVIRSKSKNFHTRVFRNDTEEEEEDYPMQNAAPIPESCRTQPFCQELALEWLLELSRHFLSRTLRYHDPEFLPSIDLRQDDSGNSDNSDSSRRRSYEQGRLHNLGRARVNSTAVEIVAVGENNLVKMRVDFTVRMLRISYWWNSFFTNGILSAYHTCGTKLPLAIFQDVDEDEVEEVVDQECHIPFSVTLLVAPNGTNDSSSSSSSALSPTVEDVQISLEESSFQYDVTWFTRHFHDLDLLWLRQKEIAQARVEEIVRNGLEDAMVYMKPNVWMRKRIENARAIQEDRP